METAKETVDTTLFPSDLRLDLSSSDAEEMEEQSAFWQYEHKQFGKGKFKGRMLVAHTRQLQLSFTSRSPGIIIRGGIPAGATSLVLPVSLEHSIYYRGQALRDHEITALNANEEIEFQTTHPSELIGVAVNPIVLDHQCIKVTGKSFNELRYQERLFINPKSYDKRIRQLMLLLQKLHCIQCTHSSREEELIEKTILEIILSGVSAPGIIPKIPHRLCVAKRAENFIRSNLKNSIPIKSLCRSLGTSERTLHQGFKERFGLSPKAYMQRMRLNGVRQHLFMSKGKETVSDIAIQWGFFHLGRFSAQYKKMFDELPSKTPKKTIIR